MPLHTTVFTPGTKKIARQFFVLTFLALFTSCNKDTSSLHPQNGTLEVWLHRVNTILKAQHFRNSYPGFELDVHFDTSVMTYIVKHDASDTSTLTLSAWLNAIPDPGRLGYWFDLKNLSKENKEPALAELLRIRQAFRLTLRTIVVESTNPEELRDFSTLNILTSFYIPYFDPSLISTEDEEYYHDYVEEHILQSGIKTISGYYIQLGFMQKWFPAMKKLTWYLDSTVPAIKDSIITETRKDSKVDVLLVSEDF
jgi:hypothetical protein